MVTHDSHEIAKTLKILHPDGAYEIRALGVPGYKGSTQNWSGYSDNGCPDLSAVSDGAVYVTLNPVVPDLLSRSKHRMTKGLKNTTKDDEIESRRWLLLDFDPKRSAGIPSSDREHNAAKQVALSAHQWLVDQGFGDSIVASSGNGWHVLIPVNLPNDDEACELVKRFIKAIKQQFETDGVEVDDSVYNAARITRLYGTVNRKGDEIEGRPHRQSRLVSVPERLSNGWSPEVAVDREHLEGVAKQFQDDPATAKSSKNGSASETRPWQPSSGNLERCRRYLGKIPDSIEGNGGSDVMLQAACECVRFDLNDYETRAVLQEFNLTKCSPPWSDEEIQHKIEAAKAKAVRGKRNRSEETQVDGPKPTYRSIPELLAEHPELNEPIIDGLLRREETCNIIASTKIGKSWLATNLALSVASGKDWLGFKTTQGRTLIIDNELHPSTVAFRAKKVTEAMGLCSQSYDERCFQIDCLRGRLVDLNAMSTYFECIERGKFDLIVLDAWYRFIPSGVSENDNAQVACMYNTLDRYAMDLGCAFVCIHHASKGDQWQKSTTDVGSGAGSISRAADAHLIIRPHEMEDMGVFDAAVRSFPPVESFSAKWEFPLWYARDAIEPELKVPKNPATVRREAEDQRRRKAILDVIGDEACTLTRIREHTPHGYEVVNRVLTQLKRDGLVEEIPHEGGGKKTRRFQKTAPDATVAPSASGSKKEVKSISPDVRSDWTGRLDQLDQS